MPEFVQEARGVRWNLATISFLKQPNKGMITWVGGWDPAAAGKT